MPDFSEAVDLAISLRDVELVDTATGVQDLQLLRHPKLGLVLVLNGEMQHAERWQALYHEPLVHVPASFVTSMKEVLVLGGGSLFAAAEILRYPTVERCVLVDHDPAVLSMMARHYTHANTVLTDDRFVYVEGDALEYLKHADARFDLIVNDCFDLLTESFSSSVSLFSLLASKTTAEGACADVIYRNVLSGSHLADTRIALEAIGPSALSLVIVPEYPGALHLLTVWGGAHISQGAKIPRNSVQLQWRANIDRPALEFYNPSFLPFHLYVPPYVQNIWRQSTDEGMSETQIA